MAKLMGRVDDTTRNKFEEPVDRQTPAFNHACDAEHGLEQEMGEIAVSGTRIFPCRLVSGRGRHYQPAFTRYFRKSSLDELILRGTAST